MTRVTASLQTKVAKRLFIDQIRCDPGLDGGVLVVAAPVPGARIIFRVRKPELLIH